MSTDSAKEKYFLLQVQYRKDPEAFARLYDMYVSRIFRFVYFKVSSEEDAQDLTAEVFLKAWEYIKKQDRKLLILRHFSTRLPEIQ